MNAKIDLKSIEEFLNKKEELLSDTAEWWRIQAQLKMSELTHIQEKLQNKWDESLAQRFETLQRELKHLELKSCWEQKEIAKYEAQKSEFDKIKNKTMISALSKKISEKLNHN